MERANRYISIIYRYSQRFFAAKLKPLDLEVGCMPALLQVCRHAGITQDGVAANTGMDKGTTARSIKQLAQQGFVIRETDSGDRRILHLFATRKGLDLLPEVEKVLGDLHTILYDGFSDDEIIQAVAYIRRMQENLAARLRG